MAEEDDTATPQQAEPLSLDAALSILTNELRAEILTELGQAWGEGGPSPAPLSYSELMERVDVIDSGRFNYHLDRLRGAYVQKAEEGYLLNYPGHQLYQAMVAGTLTERPTIEPTDVGPCPECDGTVRARYHRHQVLFCTCDGCGTTLDRIPFPAKATEDRSGRALVDAAVQKQFHDLSLFRRGMCFGCGGRVTPELTASVPAEWELPFESAVYCFLICESCEEQLITEPAHVALTTPQVGAFLADHGRDPARVPSWDPLLIRAKAGAAVVSESPMEVAIPFVLDDEQLAVHLTDDLEICRTSRTPA